jgi:hypothetical protein
MRCQWHRNYDAHVYEEKSKKDLFNLCSGINGVLIYRCITKREFRTPLPWVFTWKLGSGQQFACLVAILAPLVVCVVELLQSSSVQSTFWLTIGSSLPWGE